MSIRLRLTLLYSTILALTLIAFSTVLYFTQYRATYDAITGNLAHQAEGLASGDRRFPRRPDGTAPGATGSSPGSVQTVPPLPGRWSQIRNADGTVSAKTPDLGDATMPLSDAGLRAVQSGTPWLETVQFEDEPLLIYSLPVMTQGRLTSIVQTAAPIAEREQSLGTLRLILVIGSGLVILAAFAIGWLLAGTALRPIERITHTAQAIGAEHDFSRRVKHVGPNDEIGQLSVTFNTMLTELESAYQQVQQALQAQRRFVADASHELRTPLTTVRGNIELLKHEPPMEAREQSDVLADTKDEVERLIRLVNQLLVLARADAGKPLHAEPIQVEPLLKDVHRQIKLLVPQRTIQCDAPSSITIRGDQDALKQVLLILLDNALKHTPSSATINLAASLEDGNVAISVRDTGPGIAPNQLPHIFERFYRGEVSRSGPGAGLGLSIAKELVNAQGGTLTVTSQLGKGSVFTVRFAHPPEPETGPQVPA